MNLLIFGLGVGCVFLAGTLVIAILVRAKFGDDSASYKMFAVRDRLVHAVVFENVDRDDPWFDALYDNVNSLLTHSNLFAGPDNWRLAAAIGRYQAKHPAAGKNLAEVPDYPPPEELNPIISEIKEALGCLLRDHIGILTQMSAHRREQRRVQKAKAREFERMMRDSGSSWAMSA